MACNFKVGYQDSPFKPEYILPQIVFQWVKNNVKLGGKSIIGIEYPSTKAEHDKHIYSIVVPVKSTSPTGYCQHLKMMFNLTKPLSFHEALNSKIIVSGNWNNLKSITLDGLTVDYSQTDFCKVEMILRSILSHIKFHSKNIVSALNDSLVSWIHQNLFGPRIVAASTVACVLGSAGEIQRIAGIGLRKNHLDH